MQYVVAIGYNDMKAFCVVINEAYLTDDMCVVINEAYLTYDTTLRLAERN